MKLRIREKEENGTLFSVTDYSAEKKYNCNIESWDFFELVIYSLYDIPKMEYIDRVFIVYVAIYKMGLNGVEIHAIYDGLYDIPKMEYTDRVFIVYATIYKMRLNGVEIHAIYDDMTGTDLWIEDERKNSEQVTDLIRDFFEKV